MVNDKKIIGSFMILVLLLLFKPSIVVAQEYSYEHYGTKNGLAGSTVYGITQDKNGFMWFGTETGLSRFDGTNFKNFTIADGLPSNEIFGLYTDTRNRIWLTCLKNVPCYYLNGKIYNQENDSTLSKIRLTAPLICIAENSAGDILLTSMNDAYIITADGNVQLLSKNLLSQRTPGKPLFDPVHGIGSVQACLMALPDYVRKMTGNNMVVITTPPFNHASGYYAGMPLDKYNVVKDSLIIFNKTNRSKRAMKLSHKAKYAYAVNDCTYAFYSLDNGAALYNVEDTSLSDIYLKNYTVQYVVEDAEKNLWFSTKGSGVFKISNARFKNYSFSNLGVRNILKINNDIYIGTDNNTYWKMPALKAENFRHNDGAQPGKIEGDITTLASFKPYAYINCAGSNFLNIIHSATLYGAFKTVQIYNDTLLVAASGKSILLRLSDKKLLKTLYPNRTTCAFQHNGIYYIGTVNGLYRILPGQPVEFMGKDHPLFRSHINQITAGTDGTLWISTFEQGIIGYKAGRILVNFQQQNGLVSNTCRCLYVAGNFLWAGTDKGLNKIDIRPGHYRVVKKFTEEDGLNSNEINTIFCDSSYVYAGTQLGISVFDENRVVTHSPCNILLTRITVSGKAQNTLSDHLLLQHTDNNIRFEYAGISFLSGGDITYQYRLNGLSDVWQYTREAALSYPSLPSGKYVLQLRAINKFGNQSPVLKYSFEIHKLIWEEYWFQIAAIVLLITATAFIVRYAINAGHRKEKEKMAIAQQIMALEQMALRAQMNPHFIFNCLNSMQQYILNHDVKRANFYLSRFAGLVRQTLDNSSTVYISLAEEIAYLENYLELESLQFSGKLVFNISVDPAIDRQKINIPNMVLQPYVENAIKHGISQVQGQGYVSIHFNLDPKEPILECTIEDNGPGIAFTKRAKEATQNKHQSQGISITDKRIKTLNQLSKANKNISIEIIDLGEQGIAEKGTRVIIRFPV